MEQQKHQKRNEIENNYMNMEKTKGIERNQKEKKKGRRNKLVVKIRKQNLT